MNTFLLLFALLLSFEFIVIFSFCLRFHVKTVSKTSSPSNRTNYSPFQPLIIYFLFRLFLFSYSDFSLLYNPLIYPNSLFWPPTFFLPYQNAAAAAAVAGLTASPESPNLSNHRYTLTPEKDEAVGEWFFIAAAIFFLTKLSFVRRSRCQFVFLFHLYWYERFELSMCLIFKSRQLI